MRGQVKKNIFPLKPVVNSFLVGFMKGIYIDSLSLHEVGSTAPASLRHNLQPTGLLLSGTVFIYVRKRMATLVGYGGGS